MCKTCGTCLHFGCQGHEGYGRCNRLVKVNDKGVLYEFAWFKALVEVCLHRKMENPDWEGYNWYFDKLTTSNSDTIFMLQNFKPE